MRSLRLDYPMRLMGRVMGVSASGYYVWLCRPPSKRSREEGRLQVAIRAAHERTRGTYGPERLQKELQAEGIQAGVGRIKRLRKELGIRCKQRRKFKATTHSNHRLPVAENLLEQDFAAIRPNQIWVADLSYVPTDEGWMYLAAVKDLYTCEIVGRALSERMSKELVSQALIQAVGTKRPGAGLIHHSDRGSQYCSHDYQKLLKQFGIKASMSRKGNCYDNAPMESFFGTLKTELVYQRRYQTRRQALAAITEYIDLFYNRQRRHSRLGYLSPIAFTNKYWEKRQAA